MPNLDPYIGAVAVASKVNDLVDSLPDSAVAGGFAAWISSLTGTVPYVQQIEQGRAKLVLSKDQIKILQSWLDQQVGKSLQKPTEIPKVEYDLGPVLAPWALKYALPAGMLLFVVGMLTHYLWMRYIK